MKKKIMLFILFIVVTSFTVYKTSNEKIIIKETLSDLCWNSTLAPSINCYENNKIIDSITNIMINKWLSEELIKNQTLKFVNIEHNKPQIIKTLVNDKSRPDLYMKYELKIDCQITFEKRIYK